ncbi:MAG: hypothetical protein ACPG49_08700, partial [Chitinophagales bacterium]
MHQESWIYKGKAKRHLVQLSHDFSKGTLLLSLDGFQLNEDQLKEEDKSKKLSFFIDGELFEIEVIRKDKKFLYQFTPHIYSTSKVGKTRKKAAKRELISVNTGVSLLAVGILITVLYFSFYHRKTTPALSLGGITTTATIEEINARQKHTLKQETGKTKILNGNIRYKFKVEDEVYYGDTYLYKKIAHYYLAHTGLPIQTGDEFIVLYEPRNPNVNKILFDRPSPQKLEQYQLTAREACLKNIPLSVPPNKDLSYCECLRAYLFQQYDLEALAHIIHQSTRKARFEDFNEETYSKFMKQERQQETEATCIDLIV